MNLIDFIIDKKIVYVYHYYSLLKEKALKYYSLEDLHRATRSCIIQYIKYGTNEEKLRASYLNLNSREELLYELLHSWYMGYHIHTRTINYKHNIETLIKLFIENEIGTSLSIK